MHGEAEQYRIAIPKGSVVIMDVFGTNLSREMAGPLLIPVHIEYILRALALHWGEDAAEFKPERFIDTDTYRWPRDARVYKSFSLRLAQLSDPKRIVQSSHFQRALEAASALVSL